MGALLRQGVEGSLGVAAHLSLENPGVRFTPAHKVERAAVTIPLHSRPRCLHGERDHVPFALFQEQAESDLAATCVETGESKPAAITKPAQIVRRITLIRGRWNGEFMRLFPFRRHDDD